jgi:hypothetical protein
MLWHLCMLGASLTLLTLVLGPCCELSAVLVVRHLAVMYFRPKSLRLMPYPDAAGTRSGTTVGEAAPRSPPMIFFGGADGPVPSR